MSNVGLHALALVGDTPFTSPFTQSETSACQILLTRNTHPRIQRNKCNHLQYTHHSSSHGWQWHFQDSLQRSLTDLSDIALNGTTHDIFSLDVKSGDNFRGVSVCVYAGPAGVVCQIKGFKAIFRYRPSNDLSGNRYSAPRRPRPCP